MQAGDGCGDWEPAVWESVGPKQSLSQNRTEQGG